MTFDEMWALCEALSVDPVRLVESVRRRLTGEGQWGAHALIKTEQRMKREAEERWEALAAQVVDFPTIQPCTSGMTPAKSHRTRATGTVRWSATSASVKRGRVSPPPSMLLPTTWRTVWTTTTPTYDGSHFFSRRCQKMPLPYSAGTFDTFGTFGTFETGPITP